MTWTRVKRWLAEHPTLTIAPMVAGVTLILCLLLVFTVFVWGPPPPRGNAAGELLTVIGVGTVCCLIVGSWTFWLATWRTRAGLPLEKVLMAVLLGIAAAGALGAAFGAWSSSYNWEELEFWPVFGGIVAAVSLLPAAAAATGIYLGATWARQKIARGQWETTTPVQPANDREPAQ